MADNTSISWADDTFNPWEGCQKVGPGCDNCYAEARNARYGGGVAANWGPGAPRRRTSKANWRKPLKWEREAAADALLPFEQRKWPRGRFVFCASLADVFDNAVPDEWRRDLFDLIRATPHLTWLLLTKRPGNITSMFKAIAEKDLGPYADERGVRSAWPRNASIGCTVVNQEEAERDVQKLLLAKDLLRPAFAFLSLEPLLGQVDLTSLQRFPAGTADREFMDALRGRFWTDQTDLPNPDPRWAKPGVPFDWNYSRRGGIDWVITGGETDQGGHKARPAHHEWFRSLRDQCAAAGVPFHHKQNGEWMPICWMPDGASDDLYHPAPKRDPEATRRAKVEQTVMNRDGSLHPSAADPETYHAHHGSMLIFKIGAQRAGRKLDGVIHDARPEVLHG